MKLDERRKEKLDERSREEQAKICKVGKCVPHDDDTIPALGEALWTWLEKQLPKTAEFRFVCSTPQIIPDKKRMDECFFR